VRILISTPAYGGMVTTAYTESLIQLLDALKTRPITLGYKTLAMTDIGTARNILASLALAENYSHILFLDADMEFKPRTVERLIDRGVDVAGAVYIKRAIDIDKLLDAIEPADVGRPDRLRQKLMRACGFVGAPVPNEKVVISGGFTRFACIGMGVALIATSALRKMIEMGAAKSRAPSAGVPVYGFFDPIPDRPMGEDYSFCCRWREACGGEVWVLADEQIGHVGQHTFVGTWLDAIMES